MTVKGCNYFISSLIRHFHQLVIIRIQLWNDMFFIVYIQLPPKSLPLALLLSMRDVHLVSISHLSHNICQQLIPFPGVHTKEFGWEGMGLKIRVVYATTNSSVSYQPRHSGLFSQGEGGNKAWYLLVQLFTKILVNRILVVYPCPSLRHDVIGYKQNLR